MRSIHKFPDRFEQDSSLRAERCIRGKELEGGSSRLDRMGEVRETRVQEGVVGRRGDKLVK